MKLLKNFKFLRASSLIESIIAIVLISICSLVALTVYLNVISQNNPVHYYEAKHTIERLAHNAEIDQDFEDDSYNYETYIIEKKVTVNIQEHVALMNFTITTGKKEYSVKKLITIEDKN